MVAGSRITRLPSRYERDMLFLHSPANCFVKELNSSPATCKFPFRGGFFPCCVLIGYSPGVNGSYDRNQTCIFHLMRMAHQSFCHIAISEIFKKTVIRLTPTSICYVLYFVHKECLLCIADLYLCWLIKNWLLKHRNRTYLMNGYEPSPDLTCRQLLNFKELS